MTPKQLVQLSKLLSLILRHQQQRFGFTLDAEGYASLDEVLLAVHTRQPQATMADVHRVVDTLEPDKQRFSILDGEIRANYGHSLPGHIEQAIASSPQPGASSSPRSPTAMARRQGLGLVSRRGRYSSSHHMRQILLTLALVVSAVDLAVAQASDAVVWATAVSKHQTNDRPIVVRYVKSFRPGFERSTLPVRISLVWRYESTSGMPATTEHKAMDRMEDLLAPAVEKSGFAMLALVSTGENLREWTYYAKSEQEFLQAMNAALAQQVRFPLEVQAAPDPQWSAYDRFRRGVRE